MFENLTKSRLYSLLTGTFCALIIMSNILGTKTIKFEWIMLPCSILTFPALFIINDILSEIYGFEMTKNVIYLGLILNVLAVVLYSIAIMLPSNSPNAEAFATILATTPRLFIAGVTVPKPITSANNVLLIEFIGDENGNPSQPVKNQPPANPDEFFNKLLVELKKFVNDAKLSHGDLSNYNILNKDETPVIIDVSQSVVLDNPISKELLERDINTLVREYTKLGVKTSFEEVWEYVNPKF